MNRAAISALVDDVLERSPFPATLAENDAQTQRRVTRMARAQGVEPEALYASAVAERKATRADLAEARALALATRG
ncbi:hypothetical protein [uncultured Leifsonia sp.]|uniref:hypothetical protein n=1 Tax=uncultured Leifsonia sp. TaxID=340359 RepID=UPI0025F76536|nr:hypothetical protein [uncultured Leifsonia sp.]